MSVSTSKSETLDYTVKRSKRRTLSVEISSRAEIIVRAPMRTPDELVHRFVHGHVSWIEHHLARALKTNARFKDHHFESGGRCFLNGEEFTIRHRGGTQGVRINGNELIVFTKQGNDVPAILENWFRKESRRVTEIVVGELTRAGLTEPVALRITSARTRWGSCSAKGTVSISWRCLMAPRETQRYVVVHELVHLEHLNHSARFWKRVAEYCPQHRAHQQWLREHAQLLDL